MHVAHWTPTAKWKMIWTGVRKAPFDVYTTPTLAGGTSENQTASIRPGKWCISSYNKLITLMGYVTQYQRTNESNDLRYFLIPIFTLSFHLRSGLPSGLFHSDFPTKALYTSLPPTRATCSSHSSWFCHLKILFIMRFSPTSCDISKTCSLLEYKYS